jgi:sulfur-oxidizing protein SoxY
MKRRTLLKGSLGAGVAAIAAGAGLLSPQAVFAAWPKKAFEAKKVDAAVKNLLGSSSMANSGAIKITAPPIAENGAEVGITVQSSLAGVDSMSILVEKNGQPLAASFNMASNTEAFIRTRVKIAKTSNVHAVVRSKGKLYTAKREVKVTIGGCGG